MPNNNEINGLSQILTSNQGTIQTKEEINKFCKLIKNDITVNELSTKLEVSTYEILGLIELANTYGVEIAMHNTAGEIGEIILTKVPKRKAKKVNKPLKDELIHTQIAIVSDTHLGNVRQQLHLLNKVYEEVERREITTVLHCGDLIDGDYRKIRPEQEKYIFLRGFDEFAGYVTEYYPRITGTKTHFILGSHDETMYKNGGASLQKWIPQVRDDMIFLGQDCGDIEINKIKIHLDHPGDGSSYGVSYKLQKRIENLEAGAKPKILLVGHYHKNYYSCYRNVHGFLVPCLCDMTPFQMKKGISNVMGAYFLDIYADNQGNIEYLEPYPMIFDYQDVWDELGKDKHKVKALRR